MQQPAEPPRGASIFGEHGLVACPAGLPEFVEVEGRARWSPRPSS